MPKQMDINDSKHYDKMECFTKSLATLSSGQDKEDILGAWFMWPEGGYRRPRELPQDSTLVVYFHGNSQDRGFGHRV